MGNTLDKMSQMGTIGDLVGGGKNHDLEKFLTKQELADYLVVDKRTIYRLRLVENKGFPIYKLGGQYRGRDSAVEKWLNGHRYPNQTEDDYILKIRYDENEHPKPLKKMDESAKILKTSKRTVLRLIQNKGLPAFMVGGQVRIDLYLLNEWIENQEHQQQNFK